MNYSQFLNMIPEATLMVVLLITFIADFCSSKSADRKWFNPLVCLLMVAHIAINIFPTDAISRPRKNRRKWLALTIMFIPSKVEIISI
jgi:cell division protein FtsW (lipid II flippase)